MVVSTLSWPSSSCTVRMSAPPASSRCVAKQCRSVWGVSGFSIAARLREPSRQHEPRRSRLVADARLRARMGFPELGKNPLQGVQIVGIVP